MKDGRRSVSRAAKVVGWMVGVPVGLFVIGIAWTGIFGRDELTIQGDGSTIGASVYVDGRLEGTLVAVAGKLPQLPSTARAINGFVPKPPDDDKRPYTWLQPMPGHAECVVKVRVGASRVLFVSARGDSLEADLGYGGRGDVRVSFHLMAVQVFRET